MTTEERDLALRLAMCIQWRWADGMWLHAFTMHDKRVIDNFRIDTDQAADLNEHGWATAKKITRYPELHDWATVGLLLKMVVEEARGNKAAGANAGVLFQRFALALHRRVFRNPGPALARMLLGFWEGGAYE